MKKTILIADDHPEILEILQRRCQQLGLHVITASSAIEVVRAASMHLPDAIMIDVNMPDGDGLSVCEMNARHERFQSIPVIVLTGESSTDIMRRCHQMCAYYIPKSPDVWMHVEPVLCELLTLETDVQAMLPPASKDGAPSDALTMLDRLFAVLGTEALDSPIVDLNAKEANQKGPWVLTIEDDEDVALALRLRLKELGILSMHAMEGTSGYRNAFMSAPSAILLDYELPEGDGAYVLRRLKETPSTAHIPVIVLTGRKEGYIRRQMLTMGANAFFTKPFHWKQIQEALENLAPELAS